MRFLTSLHSENASPLNRDPEPPLVGSGHPAWSLQLRTVICLSAPHCAELMNLTMVINAEAPA